MGEHHEIIIPSGLIPDEHTPGASNWWGLYQALTAKLAAAEAERDQAVRELGDISTVLMEGQRLISDHPVWVDMVRELRIQLDVAEAKLAKATAVVEAAHTVVDCHGHKWCSRCHTPLFDALVEAGVIPLANYHAELANYHAGPAETETPGEP